MKTDKASTQSKGEEPSEDDGVMIPEEFQQHVHGVMQKVKSHAHADYISSAVSKKRDELYASEKEKGSKGKKSFSEEDMPPTI